MVTRSLLPLISLLLLLPPPCADARLWSPPDDSGGRSRHYGIFHLTLAVSIVAAAATLLFLVFFSVYLRKCRESSGGGDSRRQRRQQQPGLSSEAVEAFPKLMFAEVKGLKMGNGALECAVCLAEFEDEDELRFLPPCSHVFHPDCVGAWLASHKTCPVCRANLHEHVVEPPDAAAAAPLPEAATPPPSPGHVSIVMDPPTVEEAMELARIGSRRRRARSRSARRAAKLPRSRSTGHSVAEQSEEDVDRCTLRLPEDVQREIFAGQKLHRSASCVVFPVSGEGSIFSRGRSESWCGGEGRSIGNSDR